MIDMALRFVVRHTKPSLLLVHCGMGTELLPDDDVAQPLFALVLRHSSPQYERPHHPYLHITRHGVEGELTAFSSRE